MYATLERSVWLLCLERVYLEGTKFTNYTDHRSLDYYLQRMGQTKLDDFLQPL